MEGQNNPTKPWSEVEQEAAAATMSLPGVSQEDTISNEDSKSWHHVSMIQVPKMKVEIAQYHQQQEGQVVGEILPTENTENVQEVVVEHVESGHGGEGRVEGVNMSQVPGQEGEMVQNQLNPSQYEIIVHNVSQDQYNQVVADNNQQLNPIQIYNQYGDVSFVPSATDSTPQFQQGQGHSESMFETGTSKKQYHVVNITPSSTNPMQTQVREVVKYSENIPNTNSATEQFSHTGATEGGYATTNQFQQVPIQTGVTYEQVTVPVETSVETCNFVTPKSEADQVETTFPTVVQSEPGSQNVFGQVLKRQEMQNLQNIQIAQILQSMSMNQGITSVSGVQDMRTTTDTEVLPAEQIPQVGNVETVNIIAPDNKTVQEIQILHENNSATATADTSYRLSGANGRASTSLLTSNDQNVAAMWTVDLQHLLSQQPQQLTAQTLQKPAEASNVQVERVQVAPTQSIAPNATLVQSQANGNQTNDPASLIRGQQPIQPKMFVVTCPLSMDLVGQLSGTTSHAPEPAQEEMLPEIQSVEVVTSSLASKEGSAKQESSHKRSNRNSGRIINSINKPYGCGVCKMAFSMPGEVKSHLQHHTADELSTVGDRIFKCPVCDLTFSRSDNLKRHTRFHAVDGSQENSSEVVAKPFLCDICGQGFSRADTHKRHVKAHSQPYVPQRRWSPAEARKSSPAGAKPLKRFQCVTCGEHFTEKTAKLHHNGAQNPDVLLMQCDECNVMFCRNETLQEHLWEKHGVQPTVQIEETPKSEKVYCCPVCCLLFNSEVSLIRHKRIHKPVPEFMVSVPKKPKFRSDPKKKKVPTATLR